MILPCLYQRKKNNFIGILILIAIMFTKVSLANNKVGNGADVIFCKNKEAQLLDFYENDMKLNDKVSDEFEFAKEQIEKLKVVAPKLYKVFKRRLDTFFSEIDWKESIALANIEDSHHYFLPSDQGCVLKQIVIRKNEINMKNEKRFLIDKKLWDELLPLQRAGIIVHEIVYEYFAKLEETDSRKVRKLNAYLFQNSLPLNKAEFWKMISDFKIAIYP